MSATLGTLFYFQNSDRLREFEDYRAGHFHASRDGVLVSAWTVTAYEKQSGRHAVIAEFHAEGMAQTFRDMCEIVSNNEAK